MYQTRANKLGNKHSNIHSTFYVKNYPCIEFIEDIYGNHTTCPVNL